MTATVGPAGMHVQRRSTISGPAGTRIYAIGDVHGRSDLLEELVRAIRDEDARHSPAKVKIVMLGDLIDRGHDSAALVNELMRLAKLHANLIVLRGNHEAMMVEAYNGNRGAMRLWLGTGGDATLSSWGVPGELLASGELAKILAAMRKHVPGRVIAWMRRLPVWHREGDYLFAHAGVRPGIPLEQQRDEDLLWIREEFTGDHSAHGLMIVHGHSESADGPEMLANRIGIDTGAYRTNVLTALAIDGPARWTLQTGKARQEQPGSVAQPDRKISLQADLNALLAAAGKGAFSRGRAASPETRSRGLVAAAALVAVAILAVPFAMRTWPERSPETVASPRATHTRPPSQALPVEHPDPRPAGPEGPGPAQETIATSPLVVERTDAAVGPPVKAADTLVPRAKPARYAQGGSDQRSPINGGRSRSAMDAQTASGPSSGEGRAGNTAFAYLAVAPTPPAPAVKDILPPEPAAAAAQQDAADKADSRRRQALDLIRALRRQ